MLLIFAGEIKGVLVDHRSLISKRRGLNGMNMEYFLIKKVKQYVLMNNSRKYRTKNGYVRILNEAYQKDRNEDMSDRRKRSRLKKRERQGRWKKTRMVPYK